MISRWFELKETARQLRRKGYSIGNIESRLKIPRSTLSGWFKDIILSGKQRKKLYTNSKNALVTARINAVRWHNTQKENRLKIALTDATHTLEMIDINNTQILELVFAILYLGEGLKKGSSTGMGNSDPLILKFFIVVLKNIYKVPASKIKCSLHLRADQNPEQSKKYWSRELSVPLSNFYSVSIDKRTQGRKTYSNYKGVCVITCGTVAIQRKVVYLSKSYCEKIINTYLGS